MGWLNKIFKGSGHRISEGQYVGKYREEHVWDAPSTPPEYKVGYDNEDIDRAIALSPSEEDHRKAKAMETGSHLEDDEQLARALQESLSANSPPRKNGNSHDFQPSPSFSSNLRICAGCHSEIGHGRYLSCMGGIWHPECFCCHSCNQPISDSEFSMLGDYPYHKSCYKDRYHPKCDVCKQFIPTNTSGLIEYRAHPFWLQKYCPFHEVDGTPRCCSCERMEPTDTTYVTLDDGRKLCLECRDCSIMDNSECQPLFLDIQDFYEGLNMKITQQVPLLLVERQALNEAMEGEKSGYHYMPGNRGACLSEERTIQRRPKIGAWNRIIDMIREPYRLTRVCEVTAILILYGLPRLLTGSILAHEMMHAWLRLNGFRTLTQEVEEGICQVLAHMWLESEIMSGTGSHVASTSSSSSSSVPSSSSSSGMPKKAARSHFEKKFGEFFKHQIESNTSPEYGDGFRPGNSALTEEVEEGICQVLGHIWRESEITSGTGSHVASSSSSSSSSVPSSSSSSGMPKKAARSYFEKKFGEFFKHQIESDTSSGFGDSFRAGNSAVLKYGLRATLEHIKLTGSFPL